MTLRRKCNGAKHATEAMDAEMRGRGALYVGRRYTVRSAGQHTSENAGISNEKTSENLVRRKPKGS